MRVLIFTAAYRHSVNAGGPARSVTNLVAESRADDGVLVITADRDLGSNEPFPRLSGAWVREECAEVCYVESRSPMSWLRLYRRLAAEEFDVILVNSLWNRNFSIYPAVARALKILNARRFVVMPRGELDEGALAYKSRRKRAGKKAVQFVYRMARADFAATSNEESAQVARWFPASTVLLVRNTPDVIEPGFIPGTPNTLRLLFLGRIHPKKGLHSLLASLSNTEDRYLLRVAGPIDDRTYWEECQRLVGQLPENVNVQMLGPVSRVTVPKLLWASDLFVTLTAGENFGHTIAESLQAGCPVLATPSTPWTAAIRNGGGIIVDDPEDHRQVREALRWLAECGPDERARMRQSARESYEVWSRNRNPSIIEALRKREELDSG